MLGICCDLVGTIKNEDRRKHKNAGNAANRGRLGKVFWRMRSNPNGLTRAAISFLLIVAAVILAAGGKPARAIGIGEKAPDFALPDQYNLTHHLSDFKGKTVVLAFFPRAYTPTCTCELETMREAIIEMAKLNVVMLGISGDTVETQKAYSEEFHLTFPLLCDSDNKAIRAYGLLQGDGLAQRVTVVIDPNGVVRDIDAARDDEFYRDGKDWKTRHVSMLKLILSNVTFKVGSEVPPITMIDYQHTAVPLVAANKIATVLFFFSTNGPDSKIYAARMRSLAKDPQFQNMGFIGVDPNADESTPQIKLFRDLNLLPFPCVKDINSVVAEKFGVRRMPTVWIVGADGKALYHGSIDDNRDGSKVEKAYLRDALSAIQAGKPVPTPETEERGERVHPGQGSRFAR